jgi:hypothetical protein
MIREGSCPVSSGPSPPLQSANGLAPVIGPEPPKANLGGIWPKVGGIRPLLLGLSDAHLGCTLVSVSRGSPECSRELLGTSRSEVPGMIILTRSPDNTTVPLQSTPHCPFSLHSNESKSKYRLCTFPLYGITAG